jgi:2-hydroxychromene-2-carboxylate isomerase
VPSADIDFYLDFISPFGYLARFGLARIQKRFDCSVHYHPVELLRIKLAAGNNGPPNRAIPPKIKYLTVDLQRWAKLYGIPMVEVLPGADTARINKGLLLASDRGQAGEYVEKAWNSIWRDGLDPGREQSLASLAEDMGWAPKEFLEFVSGDLATRRFDAECGDAIARGVFGVPTFMVGEDMFWGNDRLEFLSKHLEARGA